MNAMPNSRMPLVLLAALFALSLPHALAASLPDDQTLESAEAGQVPPLSGDQASHLAQFTDPQLPAAQVAAILARYAFVDPEHRVPRVLLDRALVFFDVNKALIENQRYLTVIDFSMPSKAVRFHVIDMGSGAVTSYHCAHGKGSDPQNTGTAARFGNVANSEMSSLGYYHTGETYSGVHGLSLRLDGLSSTNSNVRARAVVVHGADYVEDSDVKAGRSWGCPAVPMADHARVVAALKGGSIMFAGQSGGAGR